jgi:pyruvate dehydrogenase E1 component
MPAMGEAPADGIIRGMYRFSKGQPAIRPERKAHLFGSGAVMTEVLRAQALLQNFGVSADVWSVTSYNELSREALRVERENLLAPAQTRSRTRASTRASTRIRPYVEQLLAGESGVFVAASDYMKALPLSISGWVPGPYVVLGTDGYGLSESRPELRTWFEVSAEYVAWAAVAALSEKGLVSSDELASAALALGIKPGKPDPAYSGPANRGPANHGADQPVK